MGVALDFLAYGRTEGETTRMGGTKSTEGASEGACSALGRTAGVPLGLCARDKVTGGTSTGEPIEGTGEAQREPGTAGLPSWLGRHARLLVCRGWVYVLRPLAASAQRSWHLYHLALV